ncbi:hypothetical protein GIB67_016429 [Kingdonia uniflora]|uniref:Uncharacterized protein n=1 Tax=Kingdonia uniflora TaxID=39325 RepID=A0A7J7MH27_9MAGN|nr:hypothetical protein GIB67_016429 [Kingdonia uniflora]
MSENFFKMMKIIGVLNTNLLAESWTLVGCGDIVAFYPKKNNLNETYHIQYHPEKSWLLDLCTTYHG